MLLRFLRLRRLAASRLDRLASEPVPEGGLWIGEEAWLDAARLKLRAERIVDSLHRLLNSRTGLDGYPDWTPALEPLSPNLALLSAEEFRQADAAFLDGTGLTGA